MANKIIRNGAVITNEWTLLTKEPGSNNLPHGKVILPLKTWQTHHSVLNMRDPKPGLCMNSDEYPSDFPGDIKTLPIIAIYFPAFTDGRSFSLGNLLRSRFGYQGELRACGSFIRDQLFYLKRCGFNSFEFDSTINLEAAAKSLSDFSESYQIAADQDTPLFRRRHP